MSNVLTFDDFQIGQEIGRREMVVTEDSRDHLSRAFPDMVDGDGRVEMTIGLIMRAYISIISPRPPGNIHAGQTLTLGRLLAPGDRFMARARCIAKEPRKGRSWFTFGLTLTSDGDMVVDGEMSFLWAK